MNIGEKYKIIKIDERKEEKKMIKIIYVESKTKKDKCPLCEEYTSSMTDLFLYSENIRKLIYTTNAIESVNSCLRKVTNGKGCFINQIALEKVLYLRIRDLEKKWKRNTMTKWSLVLNELIELFGERVEKYIEI